MAEDFVIYRGKSIFITKTMIVNTLAFIAALLAEPTYVAVLPKAVLPIIAIFLPPINVYLRRQTVRPALFIAPGATQPVKVEKLP